MDGILTHIVITIAKLARLNDLIIVTGMLTAIGGVLVAVGGMVEEK